ncbi:MAG: electron transport complex subunit RsxA [Firmicutes bacterium]|nr:electron transport complex subunit RsxA [Bacillota bacterium]
MELFVTIIGVLMASVFSGNIVFGQSMAVCQLLGSSKKMNTAVGVGTAVLIVNVLATVICFALYRLLVYLNLEYLRIITFLLITVALVSGLNILMRKVSKRLHRSLGVYLPLITTNCAIFQVMNITVNSVLGQSYTFWQGFGFAAVYGVCMGLGFLAALVLMAGVRTKNETALIPKPFRGFPIALITAGLIAMVFAGLRFSGF